MSFTAWDSVIWPPLMNTMNGGRFRVREFKTLLEWTFTPQWRSADAGSCWQDFSLLTPARGRGIQVIRFKSKQEAEEFIDGAAFNQPVLEIHDYQPQQESDWRPVK
jgi:hypothetical protein